MGHLPSLKVAKRPSPPRNPSILADHTNTNTNTSHLIHAPNFKSHNGPLEVSQTYHGETPGGAITTMQARHATMIGCHADCRKRSGSALFLQMISGRFARYSPSDEGRVVLYNRFTGGVFKVSQSDDKCARRIGVAYCMSVEEMVLSSTCQLLDVDRSNIFHGCVRVRGYGKLLIRQ
jgi:hypothetical protein